MRKYSFLFLICLFLLQAKAYATILVEEIRSSESLERIVKISNTKIYFAQGEVPHQSSIDNFVQNMEQTWTVKNLEDPFKKNFTFSLELKFEGGIQLVKSLSEIKMKGKDPDILFYVTNESIIGSHKKLLGKFIAGGDAVAFVEGRLCVINNSQFLLLDLKRRKLSEAISTIAHELGHLGGLEDNYFKSGAMNNGAPITPTYLEFKSFFKYGGGFYGGYKNLVNRLERKIK